MGKELRVKKTDMKKRILTMALLLVMALVMSGCDENVGYWQIYEINAGEVVMTKDDMSHMGFDNPGFVKLQKSGKCVINIFGEESEGTWKEGEDQEIAIIYGDDLKGSAVLDEDGTMTFLDFQGTQYKLTK